LLAAEEKIKEKKMRTMQQVELAKKGEKASKPDGNLVSRAYLL